MAIEQLFSSHVVLVDSRDEHVDDSLLWPEERRAVGEVVPGRWWDWVTGRRCARLALADLGVDPAPVLPGPRREPRWQPEVVGTITHTAGYAAAAVAKAEDVRSIGLDAEPDQPLPDGVLRRVARDEEVGWVAAEVAGVANPDRLLFSAKESIYKAWFPLTGRWLGFDDARVEIDAVNGRFSAEILVDGPLSVVTGSFTSIGGIVVTAIEVPH